MLVGLIILVAVIIGLCLFLQRYIDRSAGEGMGLKNNEKWGMEEHNKEHHE